MLAGAYYGMEGIPRRWYKKIDPKVLAEIELLSDKLLEACPLRRSF
jgi:ADP-ribosyl-[dinitrogen reductase] hydrolase